MVQANEEEQEMNHARQAHSITVESNSESMTSVDDMISSKGQASTTPSSNDLPASKLQIGWAFNHGDKIKSQMAGPDGATNSPKHKAKQSDIQLMKERFVKLLLGEDMSGGGKGVSSALAISNAITNLAASVFGEQSRLEPMPPERKARWRKEIDWLLSVTDHIVEFVPSKQKKDGINMEIMVTKQRNDLFMDIPALRKLDAMLLDCLDNFKGQTEFSYMSKDADEAQRAKNKRKDDKWWLPTPKVPPDGLSESTRKWLQFQKDSVNQVHKAAMAINAHILSEMEIPENYIESLPKNGRESLGDSIYRSITVEFFDPDHFLSSMDLSSEHKILDLKNRIEASIVIWKRKMTSKDNKSTWGSAVSLEKRELFEERAETILLILKQHFPGIPQSSLDISKIQYNRDVGHAVLESYSRVLESLAYTVMSRIEDVLYADNIARNPLAAEVQTKQPVGGESSSSPVNGGSSESIEDQLENANPETPTSMTLSDFMGWSVEQGENKPANSNSKDSKEQPSLGLPPKDPQPKKESKEALHPKEGHGRYLSKLPTIVTTTTKRFSYLERLESLGGFRSPTARH
ncbi:hypothetical protein LguiA_009932 [Lonicera macranthoides]